MSFDGPLFLFASLEGATAAATCIIRTSGTERAYARDVLISKYFPFYVRKKQGKRNKVRCRLTMAPASFCSEDICSVSTDISGLVLVF